MMMDVNRPVSAFCILCHDADTLLPFYTQTLGFKLQRAEESFYSFTRRDSSTTLCLWEIGHVAQYTRYEPYPISNIPNKVILSLTLPTGAEVEQLHLALQQTKLPKLTDQKGDGFHFIDPCGMIWEVSTPEIKQSNQVSALNRVTLLCQNLDATKAFYENKLRFPSMPAIAGQVIYPAGDNGAIRLWGVEEAADFLGWPELVAQQQTWPAHTAMLAYAFETLHGVETAYSALGSRGVVFDHQPAYFEWEFNASYFRDPENNIWELFEMPPNIEQRRLPNQA